MTGIFNLTISSVSLQCVLARVLTEMIKSHFTICQTENCLTGLFQEMQQYSSRSIIIRLVNLTVFFDSLL